MSRSRNVMAFRRTRSRFVTVQSTRCRSGMPRDRAARCRSTRSPRALLPVLLGGQMGHVSPGVERLDEPRDVDRPILHPSARMSAFSQSWKACVATVFTWSTMERQRGSRATISRQTCGTAPSPTPRTTRSKSVAHAAARVGLASAARRRSRNPDPPAGVARMLELLPDGWLGQHGKPVRRRAAGREPGQRAACTSNSSALTWRSSPQSTADVLEPMEELEPHAPACSTS